MTFGQQSIARLPDTGTGINYQYFIIICPDFQAGGVAAVVQIFFA
jgi:hypothetical protein